MIAAAGRSQPAQLVLTRRRLALLPLALAVAACGAGRAARAATLPAAVSLAAELDAALRAGNPLVVMASLDGCPFCRIDARANLH